jgi:hypothetical protein
MILVKTLARGQHGGAQPRVRGGIREAGAGGGGQFADDLGEDLGALLVLRALAVHDVFELRMASHRSLRRSSSALRPENIRVGVGNNPIWQDWGVSGQQKRQFCSPLPLESGCARKESKR